MFAELKVGAVDVRKERCMLVQFTVRNWKSFRDEATLSMIAGRSRSHAETCARVPYYRGLSLLPIAVVYGGNASGKTNLFDAIRFVRQFVLSGDYLSQNAGIPVRPFRGDCAREGGEADTAEFVIDMLVPQPPIPAIFNPSRGGRQKELIYRLAFAVSRRRVERESLSWFDANRDEHPIYERVTVPATVATAQKGLRTAENSRPVASRLTDSVTLASDSRVGIEFSSEAERHLSEPVVAELKQVAKGTDPRVLLLTNFMHQRRPEFLHVYDWFLSGLATADSGISATRTIEINSDEYRKRVARILESLGTGVDRVKLEDVKNLSELPFADKLEEYADRLSDGDAVQYWGGTGPEVERNIYLLSKEDGNLKVQKVVTFHGETRIGFENESSGTRMLVDIMPIFFDLWSRERRTWVVDEIDRQLHTQLTVHMLSGFLSRCGESTRSQLIMSTHDLLLMDKGIFRPDELIVVDRSSDGVSSLASIGDFEGVRNDLDLLKSYEDGRFGGTPQISDPDLSAAIRLNGRGQQDSDDSRNVSSDIPADEER